MKQRILQVITSMLLIVTLTMANFLLLCVDVVSYAADAMNVNKNTNHKNIEFMAYFKDERENKITELDTYINNGNLKLYFQISVKQEGYFNGNIVLNNANFRIKPEVLSESISRIENNVIVLNQINAGETKEIEVGIDLLKEEQFDLNFINMESDVSIEGIYRDSLQKDIAINSNRNISLRLVSPYDNVDDGIILSQEIITNKILNFNGEDKRVIQLQVRAGLKDNLFPIEKTIVNIQAPKILDKYPESVLVNSNDVLMTNGKMLSKNDWNYNNESGVISINIENVNENNKVSWRKNGEDKFIITYVLDKDVEINDEKSSISSNIELYDLGNTVMKASNEIILDKNEKDSIVTIDTYQNEASIYKGNLYSGISRDITYKNIVNVNLNNVADEINLREEIQTIGENTLNANYKTTRIKKSDIDNLLGEKGILNILDAVTGNIITTINKDTASDESGFVVVTYPENIKTVVFRFVESERIGKLEIQNTKTIIDNDRNIVKDSNSINLKSAVSYVKDNNEVSLGTIESNIELKETETSVDLQINRTELSAMTSNDNVEFRVVLNSREENNQLFKNPVIRLELPEKIQDIKVNYIKLLYEDELVIKSAVLNGRTIEMVLDGEQTKYKEEAIEGAVIIINANLMTSKKIPTSVEQIKLTYVNNNVTGNSNEGTVSKDINIVSYAGVVTTNQISEYGIDIVNNEGTLAGELALATDTKSVTIRKEIINNKENKISDVKILGAFPTKEAMDVNNMDIEVGNLQISDIDASRVKVYYSNNEMATEDLSNKDNNWTDSIEDNKLVKKYLVVIDELDLLETINISYDITIPSNLEYNETAEEGYTVYYKNVTIDEQVNTKAIRLGTPKGTVLETTLKTLVARKETNEVRENEVLRYAVVVANVGSEDISNVKVKANVPEGTTYVNTDFLNNEVALDDLEFEDINKKQVEFNIDNLPKGQKVTRYYEVKVNKGMSGKDIANTVTTQYGEVTKNSNETKTTVKDGLLELQLISIDAISNIVKSGFEYRYVLNVKNNSDRVLKNVKATIDTNDFIDIFEIYYDYNDRIITEKNSNNITIAEIQPGETIELVIYTTVEIFDDVSSKEVYITANCEVNNEKYNSNEVNVIAQSDLQVSMNMDSENSGKYVKAGDRIKYNITIRNNGERVANAITLRNWISNEVSLVKVMKNGTQLSEEDYSLKVDDTKNQKLLVLKHNPLNVGETIEYEIEVVVNLLLGNTKSIEIIDEASLQIFSTVISKAKITHILQPEEGLNNGGDGTTGDEDNENNENNGNNGNNGDTSKPEEYKIISGVAWIDENDDGKRDSNEKTIEGMTVKLLDTSKNEFVKDKNGNILSTTTSSTGFYSFDKVVKGQYLVIFEYDNTKYGLTIFEKEGISDDLNSNVITKTIKIDGKESKVAATQIININDNNISNINIGLVTAKNYDLQLDKYISKVTVQNNKTVTNTYKDATLVKQEIDAKQVNSTIIVVEYTIKVTNKGDVAAYVKKIADYLSSDYKFNSELNKDWYQSGKDVYCTSLANEKIAPGESREVTLTVIKEMKENNTGLINNTAEIASSYNELGLTDVNSTEGNKVKGENDMGAADLIISIRTGQVVMTVSLIVATIVMVGIAGFIIKKLIIDKRLM